MDLPPAGRKERRKGRRRSRRRCLGVPQSNFLPPPPASHYCISSPPFAPPSLPLHDPLTPILSFLGLSRRDPPAPKCNIHSLYFPLPLRISGQILCRRQRGKCIVVDLWWPMGGIPKRGKQKKSASPAFSYLRCMLCCCGIFRPCRISPLSSFLLPSLLFSVQFSARAIVNKSVDVYKHRPSLSPSFLFLPLLHTFGKGGEKGRKRYFGRSGERGKARGRRLRRNFVPEIAQGGGKRGDGGRTMPQKHFRQYPKLSFSLDYHWNSFGESPSSPPPEGREGTGKQGLKHVLHPSFPSLFFSAVLTIFSTSAAAAAQKGENETAATAICQSKKVSFLSSSFSSSAQNLRAMGNREQEWERKKEEKPSFPRKQTKGRCWSWLRPLFPFFLLLPPVVPEPETRVAREKEEKENEPLLMVAKKKQGGGGEGPLPRKSLHEARVLLPVQVKSPKLCPLSLRPLVCLAGFLSSLPMTYSRPARRCTYVHIAAAVTTKPGGEDVCNWIVRGARRVGEGEPMHYIRPPPSPRFLFFLRGGGESRLIALPRFPFSPMAAAAAAAADKKPQTT